MLYASDFDQSKYLKAVDLGEVGSEKRLKIKTVTKETDVGEKGETKPVAWFTTTDKGLMLNKTNLRVLQGAFGNAMGPWAGRVVVIYSTMANFRGQMVPALRVRIPPPKQATAAPQQPVTSGNGAAAPPAAAPVAAAVPLAAAALATAAPAVVDPELEPDPVKPLREDLDDEVAF